MENKYTIKDQNIPDVAAIQDRIFKQRVMPVEYIMNGTVDGDISFYIIEHGVALVLYNLKKYPTRRDAPINLFGREEVSIGFAKKQLEEILHVELMEVRD